MGQQEQGGAVAEAVARGYFVLHKEPVEAQARPGPSPGSQGSPASGWFPGCCSGHCRSYGGENGEGPAAAEPWGLDAWVPWQSFVWSAGLNMILNTGWEHPERRR